MGPADAPGAVHPLHPRAHWEGLAISGLESVYSDLLSKAISKGACFEAEIKKSLEKEVNKIVTRVWAFLLPDLYFYAETEELRVLQEKGAWAPVCAPEGRTGTAKSVQEWQCPLGRAVWAGTEVPFSWKGLPLKDPGSLIGGFKSLKGRLRREGKRRKVNQGKSGAHQEFREDRKPHKDDQNQILCARRPQWDLGGWQNQVGGTTSLCPVAKVVSLGSQLLFSGLSNPLPELALSYGD